MDNKIKMGRLVKVYKDYEQLTTSHKELVSFTWEWFNGLNEELMRSTVNASMINKMSPSSVIFLFGKFYKFLYKPITEQKLEYYDRTPLMFYLGQNERGLHIGININLLPIRYRKNFVDVIYTKFYKEIKRQITMKPYMAKKQTKLSVSYEILEKIFKIPYYKLALRTYYQTGMKRIRYFSYETYYRLPYLEKFDFKKKKVGYVYNQFRINIRHIKKIKNTRK